MALKLARQGLDLGVVTTNGARMLAFYRDLLGLAVDAELRFPGVGIVHRLRCGESFVKLLVADPAPAQRAPGGGFTAASGFRYCTLAIENLDEVIAACRAAGARIAVEPRPLRPGTRAAMIEDPDGNAIELLGP
jgi:catechol 2,3-dioxygenase-like lactoylglutathione lyase family enzyme